MWKAAFGLGFLGALAAGLILIIPKLRAAPTVYDQSTPQAMVESLAAMIEDGEVGRLHELVYAEDEPMRLALRRLGRLLGELRTLALTVNETFPDDVAALQREARDAAERGEATGLLARLASSATGRRANRPGQRSRPGDSINLALRQLLASPYASLDEARERLSAVEVSDDTAGVLWDGQPVLPPFGVAMRRDDRDQRWYIVLPLDLPLISRYRPRSQEQWAIAGYLLQAWENAARDLGEKTRTGEIRSLDQLASEAGAMILPPTMMIALAYAKQFETDSEDEGG